MSDDLSKHYLSEVDINQNVASIADFTFSHKIELWMNSMAENMPAILAGKNLADLPKRSSQPCIIIGGGPSIEKFNHLELLAESGFKGPILVCDKELIPCLKLGIHPYVVSSVDGDPVIYTFYNDSIVDKYASQINACFCAQSVHPLVVKRWKGIIYWFLAIWDEIYADPKTRRVNPKSISAIFHFMTRKMLLQTAGQVGSTLWHIAYLIGANPICLVGFDQSYDEDVDIKKTSYYRTFEILCKGDEEKIRRCYRRGFNQDFQNYYTTDLMFETYAQLLMWFINNATATTVNCSERGALQGGKIKSMRFKEFLHQYR